MIALWSLLWCMCSILCLYEVSCVSYEYYGSEIDKRRPVWNVAHMVNDLEQVDYFLNEGANSLEFDIWFDWDGTAKFTFHGVPCDCFRNCLRQADFITYIEYLRLLTTPSTPEFQEGLVLLFMDCKVNGLDPFGKVRAGQDLATKLIDHYWKKGKSGARAYILVSVPSIAQMDFIDSFRKTLKAANLTDYEDKIGFDFSANENLEIIKSAFQREGIENHIWQGDGITNCLPRGTSRLREALWRRDIPGATFINKVYWWTVDKMSTMRSVLRMDIDGMITNYPGRLISVLKEAEFSSTFKLATYEDNPWITHANEKIAKLLTWEERSGNFSFSDDEEELLYNS